MLLGIALTVLVLLLVKGSRTIKSLGDITTFSIVQMDTKFQAFAISVGLSVVGYFTRGWLRWGAFAGSIFFAYLGLKK
jgi:hypothetical protein